MSYLLSSGSRPGASLVERWLLGLLDDLDQAPPLGSGKRAGLHHDDEVADAIRIYWEDTHNLAEGAGAVALAALIQEKDRMRGKTVAVILSGGNGDRSQMAEILGGATPCVQQDMRRAI